jgi:hypothetical protein
MKRVGEKSERKCDWLRTLSFTLCFPICLPLRWTRATFVCYVFKMRAWLVAFARSEWADRLSALWTPKTWVIVQPYDGV